MELPGRFPLPPDDISITTYVNKRWSEIIEDSKSGRPHDGKIKNIELFLDRHRSAIDKRELRAEFDWESDWIIARSQHLTFSDRAAWWQLHRQKLEAFWSDVAKDQHAYVSAVAVQGMQATLLIHGAVALASLAVLTGQIASPSYNVTLAAKIAFGTGVVGLSMTAIGQMMLFHFISDLAGVIQGTLGAPRRMRRLYALGRYIRGYRTIFNVVNGLIYGSIFVFIVGASATAIVLLSTDI